MAEKIKIKKLEKLRPKKIPTSKKEIEKAHLLKKAKDERDNLRKILERQKVIYSRNYKKQEVDPELSHEDIGGDVFVMRKKKKSSKKRSGTYKKPYKYEKGGSVGSSVKTYSKGGYVEGK